MKRLNKIVTAVITAVFIASSTLTTSVYAAIPIVETTSEACNLEAESYYNMLPTGVKEAFENLCWTVRIKDLGTVNAEASSLGADISEGEYVAGYTDTASNTVVLSDEYAAYAINHEIGHFVDMIMNNSISQTSEFAAIYAAEKDLFDGGDNSYAKTDAYEYFAEAFREYVECAGYLSATAPQTFAYIDELMASYGGTSTLGVTTLTRADDGKNSGSSDTEQHFVPDDQHIVMIRNFGTMHSGMESLSKKHM